MSSSAIPIDSLAIVEGLIHQHKVSLSHLRARRNFFFPIFRLPPEVLAIIFTHGARDYYQSDDSGRFTPCIPTWVNVSYVCSHWRKIALDSPDLWSYHFILSLRWTEELLLRSKRAPLKISCIYPGYRKLSWWPNLLDKLLKHSERIQELCLVAPLSSLPDKLSLCAPLLEKLEIRFPWDITTRSIAIVDGEEAPIHTLKLVHCPLPWYSLNLSRLTTLSLRHVESPSPLSMAKFLAVLRNMPDLTIMELVGVLPSARGFDSSGGLDVSPKINLPHLALLVVNAPLSAVNSLLSCVNIPPRTQLSLEPLYEPGSAVGDYAPISLFLAQQFDTFEQSPNLIFRSLVLNAGYIPSLTFGLDCDFHSPVDHVGSSIPLKIALGDLLDNDDDEEEEEELTQSDIQCIISNICCCLPLTSIQSLHVAQPHGLLSDFWEEILVHLDGLRNMKLSSGSMPDLSLLSHVTHKPKRKPGQDQDPDVEHLFVPALERLELEDITFVAAQGSCMSRKSLFRALSTREGLHKRVTMTDCEFR